MMRWAVVTLLLVSCGCGSSKPTGRLTVYPVTGTVTYKGKPVTFADVTFFCEAASKSSFGRTDENGVYKPTTYSNRDGAPEGKQVVTVAKPAVPAQVPTFAPIESPAYAPPVEGARPPPTPKPEIPLKYASQATTDLSVVVSKEGPNKFDFTLE